MRRVCGVRGGDRVMRRRRGGCWRLPWCWKADRVARRRRRRAWTVSGSRDRVHRYNAEGLAGLSDRRGAVGPKRRLSPAQEVEVAEWVRRGPDVAEHGVVRWRRADLARAIEVRFGVVRGGAGRARAVGDVLGRLGFRRLVARPRHPGHDAAAQASFRQASPPVWTRRCRSTPAASRWRFGGRVSGARKQSGGLFSRRTRASASRARSPGSGRNAARVPRHPATSATHGPTCSARSVRRAARARHGRCRPPTPT